MTRRGSASLVRCRALRIIAALGVWFVTISCDALLGPPARPQTYVLTSIGGTQIHAFLNMWTIWGPDYAADGAEFYFLADTLLLYPSGRGEERITYRWRGGDDYYPNSDPAAVLITNRNEFRWTTDGRFIRTMYREVPDGRLERLPWGALQSEGMGGAWHYERVPSSGAP